MLNISYKHSKYPKTVVKEESSDGSDSKEKLIKHLNENWVVFFSIFDTRDLLVEQYEVKTIISSIYEKNYYS